MITCRHTAHERQQLSDAAQKHPQHAPHFHTVSDNTKSQGLTFDEIFMILLNILSR